MELLYKRPLAVSMDVCQAQLFKHAESHMNQKANDVKGYTNFNERISSHISTAEHTKMDVSLRWVRGTDQYIAPEESLNPVTLSVAMCDKYRFCGAR